RVFNEGGFEWNATNTLHTPYDEAGFDLTCNNPQKRRWRCDTEMKLGYINNGKVIIEFRIKIISSEHSSFLDLTKLSSPNELGNVTLVLGDKELQVSKEFLAIHSPVFAAMFYGKFAENGKDEVEIKDVIYEIALCCTFSSSLISSR
ncbi:hypothetical protein PENTCL1PPCAC_19588, partial [Pristionchus entomophagus]